MDDDARMVEDSSFLPAAGRWAAVLGRLRDVVRQEVLRSQLAGITAIPGIGAAGAGHQLRVLDVGCGQGTQALYLARAGHQVTGLDLSSELLGRFAATLAAEPAEICGRVRLILGPGERAPELAGTGYDLVLCHGVLMYLADPLPMITALSHAAAGGGLISVLVRNGLALAMRDGLLGRWPDALAAFDSLDYVNRLGLAARAHTPGQLDELFGPLGWHRHDWFGVRVFTDHRDEPAPAPAELDQLMAAEREAGRRDPYRQVAALLHVVYQRAG